MRSRRQLAAAILVVISAVSISALVLFRDRSQKADLSALEVASGEPVKGQGYAGRPVQFVKLEDFMRLHNFAITSSNQWHRSRTSSGLDLVSSSDFQAVFERGRLVKLEHRLDSQSAALRDSKAAETWHLFTNTWTESQASVAFHRILAQQDINIPGNWNIQHQPNLIAPPPTRAPGSRFVVDRHFGANRGFYTVLFYDTNNVMRAHAEWRMEFPEPRLTYWFIHL